MKFGLFYMHYFFSYIIVYFELIYFPGLQLTEILEKVKLVFTGISKHLEVTNKQAL